MITAHDICIHVGLEPEEYGEDDVIKAKADLLLDVLPETVRGAVGGVEGDGLLDDPRAMGLMLKIAWDLWKNPGFTYDQTRLKAKNALRNCSSMLLTQLRCEYGYPAFHGWPS